MGLLAVLFVTVLCVSQQALAARILMVPFGNWSHFMELDGVGRRLQARNHEVFVLLDGSLTIKTDRYTVLSYKPADGGFVQVPDEVQVKFVESTSQPVGLTLLHKMIRTYCTGMVSDKELFPRLAAMKFDLVLVDNFIAPCPFLVPYKIGAPYVAISSAPSPFFMRIPLLPSVVEPLFSLDMFGITFCEETSDQNRFMRRICRLMSHLIVEYSFRAADIDYLREYVEFPTIEQIRENASLTLVNRTPLLFSPMPKLPNVEYVGGLTTGPAKPLPKELNDWMSEAPNVVVVSFGSRFASLPAPIVEKLFTAFKKLNNFRFLMRYKRLESNKGVEVPENVKIQDWLPQNDALGHKSTVAFITHSGNNGQQEALYHGVPMLCFYVHADQKPNARRVVNRGYGKMLSIHDFSIDDLIANMKDLLENTTYSEKIKKASSIFHSEKHPAERAADAIEHILKYGGDHLRPKEAFKLTWWQFYMLDIFAILYIAFLVSVVLFFMCAKFCLSRVFRRLRGQSAVKAKSD